jgi:hypothetical protein
MTEDKVTPQRIMPDSRLRGKTDASNGSDPNYTQTQDQRGSSITAARLTVW